MSRTEEGPSVLLTQFRDFYGELIKIKRLVKSGAFSSAAGSPDKPVDDRVAEAVRERITAIMERQAMFAGRRGSDYTGLYRQAEYVMAALADEILLHRIEWQGKRAWNSHLIEYRLFRTRVAGEEFFNRLDRLLQTPDPMYKDLATIYLMAIMLGFRGRYWGNNDNGKIDFYRRQLFTLIFDAQSQLKQETKRLFPEAYRHTIDQGSSFKLPQIRIWYVVLGALIIAYVVISRSIWTNGTLDIEGVSSRIEELLR
jgi:type VI secretion system protein ImpK